jgi:hypothetical protein
VLRTPDGCEVVGEQLEGQDVDDGLQGVHLIENLNI